MTFSKKPRMFRRIKRITGEKRLSKSTLKSICFLWQSEMNDTGRILKLIDNDMSIRKKLIEK